MALADGSTELSATLTGVVGASTTGTISSVPVDVYAVLRTWLDRLSKEIGNDAELSRKSGIPTSTLSNIRSGDRRATLDILTRAVKASRAPLSVVLRQLAVLAEEEEEGRAAPLPSPAEKRPPG